MKLKYENSSLYILLMFVLIIPLSLYLAFVVESIPFDMIIVVSLSTFSVAFVYYLIYLYKVMIAKKYKSLGIKKQGYIVDSYIYRVKRYRNYFLIFLCDGKLHKISKLSDNTAYKFICNDMKEVYQYGNGIFKLKKYPIDVYFYNGKYCADIDSVNFN